MSEKSERKQNAAYEQAFLEIVDASETRDFGIEQFSLQIQRVQDELNEMLVGVAYPGDPRIDSAIEELNDQWLYGDDVAQISGRLFVDEDYEELVDTFADKWGEVGRTDEDALYFYLDEPSALVSEGIGVVTKTDEKGHIRDIKIVYVFSEGDEDEDEAMFYALPGELSHHEYDTPTPDEVEQRLMRLWPAEYADIIKFIKPDLQSQLPKRLDVLTRHLQGTLQESERFRELLAIMVNSRLALDQQLPYALTVSTGGMLHVFDSMGDPYDEREDAAWLPLRARSPLSLLAHQPTVHFLDRGDGTFVPHFMLYTYNNEDGNEPEFISIEAGSVAEFRSTRAMRSLASLALESMQADNGLLTDFVSHIQQATLELEASQEKIRVPERIADMMRLESALKHLIERAAKQAIHPTQSAAKERSHEIIAAFHDDLSEDTKRLLTEYALTFSGRGVYWPNAHIEEGTDEASLKAVLDNKKEFVTQQDGETHTAMVDYLVSSVLPAVGEDGSVIGYKPVPCFYVRGRNEKRTVTEEADIELVTMSLTTRAIIRMDGTAEVSIPALDHYRETQALLQKVSSEYRGAPLVTHLKKFSAALFGADQQDFDVLRNRSLFTKIDAEVKRIAASGVSVKSAIDLLGTLLVKRPVHIQGGVAQVAEQGKLTYSEDGHQVIEAYGQVIDVRNDLLDGDIVIALQSNEGDESVVRYVPLQAITQFMF